MISAQEFIQRRKNLVQEIIRHEFLPQVLKKKIPILSFHTISIIIVGNFETYDSLIFKQDPNFFYLTGLSLAGLILILEITIKCKLLSEKSILWRIQNQKEWIFQPSIKIQNKYQLNIESWAQLFNKQQYKEFRIEDSNTKMIHTPIWITPSLDFSFYNNFWKYLDGLPKNSYLFFNNGKTKWGQKAFLSSIFVERIINQISNTKSFSFTIFSCLKQIEKLRQHKSENEVKILQKATQISISAHLLVMENITKKNYYCKDREVEATFLEHFCSHGASPAYQPIVLIGEKGNELHGTADGSLVKPKKLLLLDVAASFYGYKSDITRTLPIPYPIGYTLEQKKIYDFLVDLLQYVASHIQPGIFIYQDTRTHLSLQSIAVQYIQKSDFLPNDKEAFLQHGIGHHVGLETHDPECEPLAPNNVIALETGYYSSKNTTYTDINIRVENIYLVTKNGFILLSYLPLLSQDIEKKMKHYAQISDKKNLARRRINDLFE